MKEDLIKVSITVNDKLYEEMIPSDMLLVDWLREKHQLTGTKKGCSSAECGACTVIMDGKSVYSCVLLAIQADGRKIRTIEGLSDGENLHPLQEAFLAAGAVQCGFCTPGFLMNAEALLEDIPNPDRMCIKERLAGNICRCTGYEQIIEAVETAAEVMRSGKEVIG